MDGNHRVVEEGMEGDELAEMGYDVVDVACIQEEACCKPVGCDYA